MIRSSGQVLVFYALVLSVVLLPMAAYAVDTATVASRRAALQAATAEAAEVGAQHIDVNAFRSTASMQIEASDIHPVLALALARQDPAAVIESVKVRGATIEVVTSESVVLPLPVLVRSVVVSGRALARISPGYDSPSSFLPFSTSTL